MNKYIFFGLFFIVIFTNTSCQTKKGSTLKSDISKNNEPIDYFINIHGDTIHKIVKTADEWKKMLTEKEYYVLREKGTERPFTGDLLNNKTEGLYTCRGCGLPLFASKYKFESGTGWPSFFDVPDVKALHLETDYDLGYPRTELTCAKCGGHLGHVFDDGQKPTNKRYCINAVALDFIKTEN